MTDEQILALPQGPELRAALIDAGLWSEEDDYDRAADRLLLPRLVARGCKQVAHEHDGARPADQRYSVAVMLPGGTVVTAYAGRDALALYRAALLAAVRLGPLPSVNRTDATTNE